MYVPPAIATPAATLHLYTRFASSGKRLYLSSNLSEWSGPLCSIHFDARRLGVGKQASKQGRRKTGTDLCLRCTTLINREAMQPSSAHVNYIYRRVLLRGEDGGRRNGDIKITRCKSSRRNRKYTHLSPLTRKWVFNAFFVTLFLYYICISALWSNLILSGMLNAREIAREIRGRSVVISNRCRKKSSSDSLDKIVWASLRHPRRGKKTKDERNWSETERKGKKGKERRNGSG